MFTEDEISFLHKQILQELRAAGFEAYCTADNKIQCITDATNKLTQIRKIVGDQPTTTHVANGKIYLRVL
ncbi:hypothetical protein JW960_03625 [candidate division KSB1 bacterium]|nr:hypothetical protein [candidate division KSB1 bacterium]